MYSVSIITPTTDSRSEFNERLSYIVQQQDYPNIVEHLYDYAALPVGMKLNRLCKEAKGEIIIRFDSDDRYSDDWITKSVEYLLSSNSALTGLREGYFDADGKIYQNLYKKGAQLSLLGATMVFYKSTWDMVHFRQVKIGEDVSFCNDVASSGGLVAEHDYKEGFLATIHNGNTSPKRLELKSTWKRVLIDHPLSLA